VVLGRNQAVLMRSPFFSVLLRCDSSGSPEPPAAVWDIRFVSIYLYPSIEILLSIYLYLYLYIYTVCTYIYLRGGCLVSNHFGHLLKRGIPPGGSEYISIYILLSIYLFTYTCIYVYIYIYVYIPAPAWHTVRWLPVSIYLYLPIYLSIYLYIYLHLSLSLSLYIYIYIYICIYICCF